ncbi:chymotrypsin inhibitor-like [Musca domestica]|uniref:Chymotrypsin inhibitor-like n=1 Tax=Musca domestica TaxID=7370 RepID=A0A9J7ICQ3_MUSDO|nr:chymotrypsin inhibitor-like [Musca domestica]
MVKLSKQFVIIFAVLALFIGQGLSYSNSKQCGPNQEFNACGTACPLRCGRPRPEVCTAQCVAGCQCKTGYALNSYGSCVPLSEC